MDYYGEHPTVERGTVRWDEWVAFATKQGFQINPDHDEEHPDVCAERDPECEDCALLGVE